MELTRNFMSDGNNPLLETMKREIKFRAWDAIFNKWFHPVWDITNPFPTNNGHVIMQYTGLKDKNGKEIYEGDAVLIKDDGFKTTRHCIIKWNEETMCLAPSWYANILNVYWEYEIIGNIYENPELL